MDTHKLPSFLGASIFGLLFLISFFHLRLLNHRKYELLNRAFGAQATLDEPFRRSIRAKAAFQFIVTLTCALEIPLFLAFHFNEQNSDDDDGCSSSSEQALISFEVPDVEPRGWIDVALALHLIASAGYPIVLVIVIGMWTEVVKNVPGRHRPSMAVRDHGSNHDAREERRRSQSLSSFHSHSSNPSSNRSSISSYFYMFRLIRYCCGHAEDDDDSEAGYSLAPEHQPGVDQCDVDTSTQFNEFECCGTRPLKHRPLLVSGIFLYFSVSLWAAFNALLFAGGSYTTFHHFLAHNTAYIVHYLLEPPLLFVLALGVLVSGRRLRHRVKFSDGPRLRKIEGKIALVALASAFLAIIRAFAVLVAVFTEFHAQFIPRHGCENGRFAFIPLVWASLLSTLLPHAGLFAGLMFIMGSPKELPLSANINEDNIWNASDASLPEEDGSDHENQLVRSRSSPPVLIDQYSSQERSLSRTQSLNQYERSTSGPSEVETLGTPLFSRRSEARPVRSEPLSAPAGYVDAFSGEDISNPTISSPPSPLNHVRSPEEGSEFSRKQTSPAQNIRQTML